MKKNYFIYYILIQFLLYSISVIFRILQDSMTIINLLLTIIYFLFIFISSIITYNKEFKPIIDNAINIYNNGHEKKAYGSNDFKFNRWLLKRTGVNDEIKKEVKDIHDKLFKIIFKIFISFIIFIISTVVFLFLTEQV